MSANIITPKGRAPLRRTAQPRWYAKSSRRERNALHHDQDLTLIPAVAPCIIRAARPLAPIMISAKFRCSMHCDRVDHLAEMLAFSRTAWPHHTHTVRSVFRVQRCHDCGAWQCGWAGFSDDGRWRSGGIIAARPLRSAGRTKHRRHREKCLLTVPSSFPIIPHIRV